MLSSSSVNLQLISWLLTYQYNSADGWPELDNTLRNLLSPTAATGQQKLFYEFITEYPVAVADMPVADLRHGLRHGLGAIETDPSLVADALKACVSILTFDDRYTEFKDIIPEMLNVRLLLPAWKNVVDTS